MKLRMFIGLVATAFTMLASDINGKWTASMEGPNGQTREMTYNFKTDGDKTTGMVVTQRGERPLEDVKVTGETLTWSQTMNRDGESRKSTYTGMVAGDEIKVKMKAGDMEREFTMKRAK